MLSPRDVILDGRVATPPRLCHMRGLAGGRQTQSVYGTFLLNHPDRRRLASGECTGHHVIQTDAVNRCGTIGCPHRGCPGYAVRSSRDNCGMVPIVLLAAYSV